MKPVSEMSQTEINRFCRAATAVYFSIVRAHAVRTGERVGLPALLCPEGPPPDEREFTVEELEEAERFLYRIGVIGEGEEPSG